MGTGSRLIGRGLLAIGASALAITGLVRAWQHWRKREPQRQQPERDPEQAWFWTDEWQAKEREADADIKAGRMTRSESDAEFLRSLESESE
jgi:gamma-glutamyl:cysteine ligase YbdK (ATP-grasp superfamily)